MLTSAYSPDRGDSHKLNGDEIGYDSLLRIWALFNELVQGLAKPPGSWVQLALSVYALLSQVKPRSEAILAHQSRDRDSILGVLAVSFDLSICQAHITYNYMLKPR